ncbi:MAG: carboxypeptidase regulatory-like domain-containing protein [Candidatus Thermoplasmatota archaeon]|nr:carboxypeptidase regulatory-like domain-containing protein [Candidatus Thermoplasmatota archaeon]
MNRLLSLILCGAIITYGLVALCETGIESAPAREAPDLRPVVNVPENNGRYKKEDGLRVNVTLFNDGADMGMTSGNLSLIIYNLATGEKVPSSFFPKQFSGIGAGESRMYEFPDWTGIFSGRFMCNISASYPGDANPGNNYVEHVFSVWSDQYQQPELSPMQVKPIRGNTTTLFDFKAEFSYNIMPNWVKIEIDDELRSTVEEDPQDDIPNDGKIYVVRTLLPIGNHRYRFIANVTGLKDLVTPYTNAPWVNLSLKNANVTPVKGYVTTPFRFSVDYGSENNTPPDSLIVDIDHGTFDLTRSSPNPDYQSGRVEFATVVQGMDLLPSPVEYHVTCVTDGDEYSVGPFKIDGPNMTRVELTGRVTDLVGTPLEGVEVCIDPGETTVTDGSGNYSLTTYVGPKFDVSYYGQGYLPRSYQLDLFEDRNLNIELEPIPVGGSVKGFVRTSIGGEISPLSGATVNLSGPGSFNETLTGPDGSYLFEGVPSGSAYTLRFSEYRHNPVEFSISVVDGHVTMENVTLTERDMGVVVAPAPGNEPISIDQVFVIDLPAEPDPGTMMFKLENATSPIPLKIEPVPNSTRVEVSATIGLLFNSQYTLHIQSGIDDKLGNPLVWRNLSFSYSTEVQPIGALESEPGMDAVNVPLDQILKVSFGIGLNHSSFQAHLFDMDRDAEVIISAEVIDTVNWSDSGRTSTQFIITPERLDYQTRYSLDISSILKDIHSRSVLSAPLSIEFTTVREPDTDGDGVPDSKDAFPDDPSEWLDTDGDGVGDNSDDFPDDPSEWSDLDGDGIGDNADDDDDGDGMPDAWEIANGLDPADPRDAFLDEDGDGYNNLREYLEGTDPLDKGDHPDMGGAQITLILLIVAIVVVILIALALILYMTGVIGKKKESPIEE